MIPFVLLNGIRGARDRQGTGIWITYFPLNPHTEQPANVHGGGFPVKPDTMVGGGNKSESCQHARKSKQAEASRKYRNRVNVS